jgi:hypothetical protein
VRKCAFARAQLCSIDDQQFHKVTGSLLISHEEALAMASRLGKAWVDAKM